MRDHITPDKLATVKALIEFAAQFGLTSAQLAIAWLLRWKEVSSVITGASQVLQLEENLLASQAVEYLTNDVLERIEEILGNAPEDE